MQTLIVGATSSIGLATTRAFVAAGHRVMATSRQRSPRPSGLPVTWSDLDLLDVKSIKSFAESSVPAFGPLDAVVVLAGVLPGQQLADYTDEELDWVMTVNFSGPARVVRALLPHLSDSAHIIMASSVSGLRGSFDPIYAASKAALIGFTKSLATSLAPKTRVNTIAPGLVQDSTMYHAMLPERRNEHVLESPTGQLVTLEEVAELLVQLTGRAWSNTTGRVISIGDTPND